MSNRVILERDLQQLKGEKLKRLELEISMARYRLNPDLWLQERFGEDPRAVKWDLWPGYSEHEWDGDANPLYAMWRAIAYKNWAALESATSTGKTYTLARIVYWFLDCYENSLVVTSAPKEQQLTLHLWSEISRSFSRFKKIRPYADLTYLKLRVDRRKTVGDGEGQGDANSWMAVGFVAGVSAGEESTTKAQGFHRKDMLIITEETPGMPSPTMTAFENTSTAGNNIILSVGNPDSQTDTLHQFAESSKVKLFRASAYDHPNVVLNKEVIPGAVTMGSVDVRMEKYGKESNFFKSRVRGISPAQGVESLVKYDWLLWCWKQHADFKKYGEILPDGKSRNALGVDVANSEQGDMASLAWGRSNTLVRLHEFQCPNANHLAYNLYFEEDQLAAKEYQNYKTDKLRNFNIAADHLGVDGVGVGVATVNTLHDMKIKAISLQGGQLDAAIPLDKEEKPLYKFSALRSQMYYEFGQDVQNRKIIFDIPDAKLFKRFAMELTLVDYTTKGGAIQVTHKADIKKRLGRSPNMADSVVYWNWMRRGYYKTGAPMLPMSGGR